MEGLFAGKQDAKQALAKMTSRSDELLTRFERTARE